MSTTFLPDGLQGTPTRGMIEQNASGKGVTAPKNIINSTQAARTLYEIYRRDHLKRIALYSQIEGLIAGNPPYDPVDLQRHGLAHIANFNSLDGRAIYERAALAYWNLLYSAERVAKFTINIQDAPETIRIASIMEDNFNRVVKSWPSFRTAVNTLIAQVVKFGVSPIFWDDERDWRWRTVELQRFFVPPMAQTDIDQLTNLCIESTFTAQYLFEVYDTYKDMPKEKSPWDCEALAALLLFYANSYVKPQTPYTNVMEVQQQIQSGGEVFEAFFSDAFKLVSLYYKEYDGKISHYMFDRYFDNGNFLYFVDRQYDSFDEALVIFTASPGEFIIHSNRGVGHKIFSACQAMMQVDCAVVDMAKITSTPFVKTLATGAKDFEQIRVYPGTITNIGSAEFVSTNFGANIQQLLGTSQFLMQKINYNAANSGDDPALPDRNAGSLSAVQSRTNSFKEFGVLKNNIQHFYSFFDIVIQGMVTKMLHCRPGYPGYDYAKEWKDSCIAQGVPPEIFETKGTKKNKLPPQISVQATRVAGDGSTAALVMGLEALMPIAGSFTEAGTKEFQRQWVRAIMGPDYVGTFISDKSEDVGAETSLAAVENAVMEQGSSPVVSPANEHQTHIITHTALANDVIMRVKQQQMTPIDADRIFSILIPHNGEHISLYSQSIFSRNFLESYKETWKEITRFAENNRVMAAKMAEAAIRKRQEEEAAQNQVMTEEQRKDFQAQKDEQRKDFKVQSQVERARDANENRAQVMREKVQLDAQNKRLATELENQNEQTKVQGEIQVKTQKNQLEQMSTNAIRSEVDRMGGDRPAQYDFE